MIGGDWGTPRDVRRYAPCPRTDGGTPPGRTAVRPLPPVTFYWPYNKLLSNFRTSLTFWTSENTSRNLQNGTLDVGTSSNFAPLARATPPPPQTASVLPSGVPRDSNEGGGEGTAAVHKGSLNPASASAIISKLHIQSGRNEFKEQRILFLRSVHTAIH